MHWDLYCRVIDNHGDIGVAWRLAADLGARGEQVRLCVDDRSALVWMAPRGAPGVDVVAWEDPGRRLPDVVVELFGAGLPASLRESAAGTRALCINLEHLSAETYVERCHRLPSPAFTPAGPLTTWFFYPGFTSATGGLSGPSPGRAPTSDAAGAEQRSVGALLGVRTTLRRLGIEPRAGERLVSLFCYDNPAVGALINALRDSPTLLLLTPGAATRQATAALGPSLQRDRLRACALPHLAQAEFDALLDGCDLNIVRGEDSFVRAMRAGAPFVWQLYPQDDGAHAAKLEAFLALFLKTAAPSLAACIGALFRRWNAMSASADEALHWPQTQPWREHCERWRRQLASHADLTTQLVDFARARRLESQALHPADGRRTLLERSPTRTDDTP